MATAEDVAAYILDKKRVMAAMRLQKLLYYGQAWHLVTMDAPLFDDEIRAYPYGPVVYSVWSKHQYQKTVSWRNQIGDPSRLTDSEREVVDAVLEAYRKNLPFEL